jgi:hypothetical protein
MGGARAAGWVAPVSVRLNSSMSGINVCNVVLCAIPLGLVLAKASSCTAMAAPLFFSLTVPFFVVATYCSPAGVG